MDAYNRLNDVQVNMRAPASTVDAIDDWRAVQRPILSRSEAIRVLVLKGLETEAPPKRERTCIAS